MVDLHCDTVVQTKEEETVEVVRAQLATAKAELADLDVWRQELQTTIEEKQKKLPGLLVKAKHKKNQDLARIKTREACSHRNPCSHRNRK